MALTCRAIGSVFNSMASFCESGLRNRADAIPLEPDVVELLTFRDVVEWMTDNRPPELNVVRSALLREEHGGMLKVVTVFLDAENKLVIGPDKAPYGRAQRVRQLDKELSNFFRSRAMVIFE